MPDRQLMTFEAPRVEHGDDDAADLVCAPQPADTRARLEAEGPVYHRTWVSLPAALHHDVFMTLARAADRTTSIGFGAGGMIRDRFPSSSAIDVRWIIATEGPLGADVAVRLGDGVFNMTSNGSSAHHRSFVYGTVMDEGGALNRPLATAELIASFTFTGSAADCRSRIRASRDPFASEVAFQPGGPDTARELESSSRVVEGV